MDRRTNEAQIDLLQMLDALVKSDGAPSGLSGEIGIGIRRGDGDRWWRAKFGACTETVLSSARPEDMTASLLLSGEDADAMFADSPTFISLAPLEADGDVDLLTRFIDRYVFERSFVDIRAGQRSGQRQKKRSQRRSV